MKITHHNSNGFTLVELMVTMCIALVAGMFIWNTFSVQSKTYTRESQQIEMNQNVRVALYQLNKDIRMTGYMGGFWIDTTNYMYYWRTKQFGSDLKKYPQIRSAGRDLIETEYDHYGADTDGYDNDGDGSVDSEDYDEKFMGDGDMDDTHEQLRYEFLGNTLLRNNVALAEDIEAIGFGFAYDNDRNGEIDFSPGGSGEISWAFDADPSDTDDYLNREIDTNGDGSITIDDGEGGIAIDEVPLYNIMAVRVWILARSRSPEIGITDSRTYKVGDFLLGPFNDSYRRRLVEATIFCRNTNSGVRTGN
jgi:type IV pilus assembly protein PilW